MSLVRLTIPALPRILPLLRNRGLRYHVGATYMPDMRVTRRALLGSVGAASMSPLLTNQLLASPKNAAMQYDGDPFRAQSAPAFEALLVIGANGSTGGAGSGWAAVTGGEVRGPLLTGKILPGRIAWRVDMGSRMVEVTAGFSVQREDGTCVEVRDRALHPQALAPAAVAGLCTSPELLDAATGLPLVPALLVGRLDASDFRAGKASLRVFRIV